MSHSRQLAQSVPNQLNAIAKRIHDENQNNPQLKASFMLAALVMRVATHHFNALSDEHHNWQVKKYGQDNATPAAELYLIHKYIISAAFMLFFISSLGLKLGDKTLNRAATAYANNNLEQRLPTFDKALRFGLFYIAPEQPRQAENNQQEAPTPQRN